MRAAWTLVIFVTLTLAAAPMGLAEQPVDVKSPLSPEESLKYFQLDPLLSIELVAAEPQVVDPVAMRFDEDGRLWVAEMRDYPLGPIKKTDGKRTEKDAEPLSQIKILEDKDGDGRFETATVFADKLLFVTGLQPWKGGVIVTLSGKVAYMKDTDGDGKADVNETWFTGFSESNSQLRANHPTFALDNHIYIANGLRGGMVVNHLKKLLTSGGRKPPDTKGKDAEDAPINISGMDFRFDPLTGDAEAVSGNGQFGLCFDDWGNRFVCSNRNPCQHVVIENRYLKKAPAVAIPSVVQDVAAFAENSRIYPISKFWTTSNLHEGQFTAACGVFIYRGDLLPQQFRGNVFTCDPTGNLIHREIMTAKGASFTSKPAYEGKEFLASPDTWFRPVSMELGPDGALYVVDMYRAVIEHPEWVPDELKNRPDERLGDDRGRIYRIVPKGRGFSSPVSKVKQLSQAKSEGLVPLLECKNAWRREAAHRLLFERQAKSTLELLRTQIRSDANSCAAAHAFWLSLNLSPKSRLEGLATAGNPLLRKQWFVAHEKGDTWLMLNDPDPRVRFQVMLYSDHPLPVTQEFSLVALKDCGDPWARQAMRLSLANETATVDLEILGMVRNSQLIFLLQIPYPSWRGLQGLAYLVALETTQADRLRVIGYYVHRALRGRHRLLDHLTASVGSLLSWVTNPRTDQEAFSNVRRTLSRLRLQPDHPSQDDLRELVRIISFHAAQQEDYNSGSYFVRKLLDDQSENHDQSIAGLDAFMRGLEKRRLTLAEFLEKSKFAEDAKANVLEQIRHVALHAIVVVRDENSALDRRLEAIALLGHISEAPEALLDLTSSPSNAYIRRAAISALSRQAPVEPWKTLLEHFGESPPGIRAAILDGVLQRPERISLLLDSLESGSIKPAELDPVQTGRLLKAGDANIRARAEKIFGSATPEDRKKALADYQSVLAMTGDAKRGQVSFAKNCATCHKIGETGVNVAPDISDSRTKTPAQILADIIQPNRAIDANYVAYQLLLADGTTASGILTSETSTSITLKAPGAKIITVARGEIEQLKSAGVSLMPDGLEKTIPPQEMADVIAFIKNWRYLDGRVPVKN